MIVALDIFEIVSAAPVDEINPVVRSVFSDSSAKTLPGWTVESLQVPSIGVGTLALMRVRGKAQVQGEVRPWSSVLKIMDCTSTGVASQIGSPIREIEAYRSGLFGESSHGIRSAKVHGISEKNENIVWLWTEDLVSSAVQTGLPWSSYQYLAAAEALGNFKGHLLAYPVQKETWMNYNAGISRWTSPAMMKVGESLDRCRDSDYVRTALPGKMYDRALNFGAEMSALAEVVDRVPQVLSHGDFHVRNLFPQLDHSGSQEFVAIDLSAVGVDSVGVDVGTLVGSSLTWGDDEANTVMSIEREVFNSFVGGLRSQGCDIPDDTLRLGYLITVCGYGRLAAAVPSAVVGKVGPWQFALERYGDSKQQLPYSYRGRIEFVVSMFDEARDLAGKL